MRNFSGSDWQIAYPSLLASFTWTIVLAAAVTAGSFVLSCSMPFAALAVALAATVGLRASLAIVGLVWILNQLAGFTLFHFPWTLNAVGHGAAIGLAALLAAVVAHGVLRRRSFAWLLLALAASFVVYETALWSAALFLGGRDTFALPIVTQLGLVNVAWFVGIIALNEIAAAVCKPWLGRIPMVLRSSESA